MCPAAPLSAKISFHLNFSRGKGRKSLKASLPDKDTDRRSCSTAGKDAEGKCSDSEG